MRKICGYTRLLAPLSLLCCSVAPPEADDIADVHGGEDSLVIEEGRDWTTVIDGIQEDGGPDDSPPVQFCPGGEGDCGWRCCSGPYADYEELRDRCWTGVDPDSYDTSFKLYDAERVTPDTVAGMPPLSGWTWRTDGTEMAVLGSLDSCRRSLECQEFCWDGSMLLFVLDVVHDRQIHVEGIPASVGSYPWRWPYSLGGRYPLPHPRCPDTRLVLYGDCFLVEIPERGVGYAFYDIPSRYGDPDREPRWYTLPLIHDAVDVLDLATGERIGSIALTVPER